MQSQTGYICHIKDKIFDKKNDNVLMQNHEKKDQNTLLLNMID